MVAESRTTEFGVAVNEIGAGDGRVSGDLPDGAILEAPEFSGVADVGEGAKAEGRGLGEATLFSPEEKGLLMKGEDAGGGAWDVGKSLVTVAGARAVSSASFCSRRVLSARS